MNQVPTARPISRRGAFQLVAASLFVFLGPSLSCTLEPDQSLDTVIAVMSTSPEPLALGMPRDTEVSFWFDRPLHPGYISWESIEVSSVGVRQYGVCSYDPIERRLTYHPDGWLRRNLAYNAILSESLRGLRDGFPVEATTITFITGEDALEASLPPEPSYRQDVEPIFQRSCASARCHGGASPAANLDLSSRTGLLATAIAVESSAWSAWSRIDPYSRAWSYLIYKIIDEETIRGDAMPPGSPLSLEDQIMLARWIDAGAKVDHEADAP